MSLPNVICIGTTRSGTTWLYDCLNGHPQIFLPDCKDICYFRAWAGRPSLHERHGLAPYQALFEPAGVQPVRLDVSAGLLGGSAAGMHGVLPDCKLIAILRNPVDRAFSHHDFLRGRTHLKWTLRELAENSELPDPHEILSEGLYARHLEEFLRYYPRERLLVLFYGDLVADPATFLRRVYEFVGVDTSFEPARLRERINGAVSYRIKALDKLNTLVGTYLLSHRLNELRRRIRRTGLPALVRKMNTAELAKAQPDPATRAALIEYYRSDIGRLETLLGRELSQWLR